MTTYDWEKIKEDFIYGCTDETGQRIDPTLKQLSTKYGCGYGTIRDHASREGWSEEKDKQRTKINRKIQEHKTNREAQDIVLSDEKFESDGETLRRITRKKMQRIEEDLDDDERAKNVRAYDLKMVGDALAQAQAAVKAAQGEILEKSKLEIEDKTPKKQNNVFARVDSLMMFIENGNDSNDDRELQSEKPDNS